MVVSCSIRRHRAGLQVQRALVGSTRDVTASKVSACDVSGRCGLPASGGGGGERLQSRGALGEGEASPMGGRGEAGAGGRAAAGESAGAPLNAPTPTGPARRSSSPDQLLFLDGEMNEDDELVVTQIDHGTGPNGLSNYLYPIYLPMDQEFKTKYVFSTKRKPKSLQENVYLFLEHPGGWMCFIYHFSV